MVQNNSETLIIRKNVIEFNCFNKIFANTREIIEFNMGKKWNSSTAFQIRESALKTIPQAFSCQTLNPIKKNQKSITANIKNYIKTCLFKNFPLISLFFEIIETLETIEFKTPIIEFKCFKAPQLSNVGYITLLGHHSLLLPLLTTAFAAIAPSYDHRYWLHR